MRQRQKFERIPIRLKRDALSMVFARDGERFA
jgi:hypothetical protein